MLTLAVFGINNDSVNTAVNVLILVLVVVWAALIFWTFADARRRIDDPMLVACATAASLFPFVGTIIYVIVRPPEFLDDVRLRELEMQAAEARLTLVRLPAVPVLRLRGQGRLPALSQLHAAAQGALLLLRQADRPRVEAVPVLRGRDGRRPAALRAPPAPGRHLVGASGLSGRAAAEFAPALGNVARRSPPVGTDQNCSAPPQAATGARNP